MGNGFLRFQKQQKRRVWIKSGIFGLSVGVLAGAVATIIQKLTAAGPRALVLLPAAIAALVGLGLMLLWLYPTDKRLAKRLDTALALGERVQTMVAYRNDEGEMAALQRTDTDQRLQAAPRTALREWPRVLWHLIAPVLAAAALIAAILIPQRVILPPAPPAEPDYEATDWQKVALAELIEEVKASVLEQTPKAEVVTSLEELLASLDTPRPASALKADVVNVIGKVHRSIDTANSYNDVSVALFASTNEQLKKLGTAIGSLSGTTVRTELSDALSKTDRAALPALLTALRDALATLSLSPEDELAAAFTAFAAALQEAADGMETHTDTWLSGKLNTAFTALSDLLNNELFLQHGNEQVRATVIARLMTIFGLTTEDLPDDLFQNGEGLPDADEGVYEPEEDDKLNSGGYGDAEQVFGSNDMIYDPIGKRYVSYGELLGDYHRLVSAQLLSGQTPDTLSAYITKYFTSLYDGSKSPNE
jgi:hypothetical protein